MALTFDAKKNFAYSVVAVAPAPAASGTSLQVAPGDGTKFPAVPFNAVVWPAGVQPTTTNAEVIRVTNIATDTFTIVRTQESTSARTIVINDQIAVNITAKALTDIEAAFVTAGQTTCPVGSVQMWLAGSAPTGWLLLQGQAISRATYSELFALWGTSYGAGDGATTFNVPDFQTRIPIGKSVTLPTLGAVTGSWDHTHGPGTLAVASHTHGAGTLAVASHTHDSGTLQAASHTHGPGTLSVAGHTHDSGTYSTTNDGAHTHNGPSHTHTFSTTSGSNSGSDVVDANFDGLTLSVAGGNHTHSVSGTTGSDGGGLTSSNGTHSHNVSFGNSGSTAPSVTGGLTASTAPAVNSGNTGATAPAVSSGATAATAPAVNAGATASANPPVIVVNFIVRAVSSI